MTLRFHREATERYKIANLEALIANGYELLGKIIDHHLKHQVPRLQELHDYANGKNHGIITGERRRNDEAMADTRASHNFAGMIATFKQGHFNGVPIQTIYDDETENDTLQSIANINNFEELEASLALDVFELGRAYDIVYRNVEDETRVRKLSPFNTFVIYDTTLEQKSIAGVYYYQQSIFDDNVSTTIELYTNNQKIVLKQDREGKITEARIEGNLAGGVQITEYLRNDEGQSTFEPELDLIDLYDAAQSDTANYMTDLSDAILAIFGMIDFPEDMSIDDRIAYTQKMYKARLLQLIPPKDDEGRPAGSVDAKYLYKQYDVSGTESYKTRITNDIHKFTNSPDLTDENFAGTQSGEAMKLKLFFLEQERATVASRFEKSLKRRYKLITQLGKISREITNFNLDKLKFVFTPNLPQSDNTIIDMAMKLDNVVSDKTILDIVSRVTGVDANEEIMRLETENTPLSRLGKMVNVNERDR